MIEPSIRRAAALALGLVLAVVWASAAIRLGSAVSFDDRLGEAALRALRLVHRGTASLEVLAVLWLGWLAWRARARRPELWRGAALALALSALLALLGVAAGRNPPPAAALGNLGGGLALAASLAWLAGAAARSGPPAFAAPAAALGAAFALQAGLGAQASVLGPSGAGLLAHVALGLALASGLAWLAFAQPRGAVRAALCALALLVPLAGLAALLYERSAPAALGHAAAVAAALALAAFALGRASRAPAGIA